MIGERLDKARIRLRSARERTRDRVGFSAQDRRSREVAVRLANNDLKRADAAVVAALQAVGSDKGFVVERPDDRAQVEKLLAAATSDQRSAIKRALRQRATAREQHSEAQRALENFHESKREGVADAEANLQAVEAEAAAQGPRLNAAVAALVDGAELLAAAGEAGLVEMLDDLNRITGEGYAELDPDAARAMRALHRLNESVRQYAEGNSGTWAPPLTLDVEAERKAEKQQRLDRRDAAARAEAESVARLLGDDQG